MTQDRSMLLRIYTDEAAYYGDRKVFEVIATRARESGLAGATILQALLGFGRGAHVHRRHLLEDDQSVVIEIIDKESELRSFVNALSDMDNIGLATIEPVEVLVSRTAQELKA